MKFNLSTLLDKKTIKDFFIYSVFLIAILNSILGWNYYQLGKQYSVNGSNTIMKTIEEFGEIDLSHICNISNCVKVSCALPPYDGNLFIIHSNNILKNTPGGIIGNNILVDFDIFKITTDFTLIYSEPKYSVTIESDTNGLLRTVIITYIIINITFFVLFSILFLNSRYREKRKQMLQMMGTEGSLREQNMRILTENIHHELNTPVAIIRGSLKKYEHLRMLDMTSKKCSQSCNILTIESLNYSEMNYCLDQIDTVLQRMSNFKQIKYSNGNKTVIDIVKYSANSMNIYKRSNFKIDIDNELSKYNLLGDLGNGDLMNIVSNHLRNSLEASSTKIIIEGKFIEDKRTPHIGKMHIFIIDNGIGIRDRRTGLPLDKRNLNDVFKPYYSTKDSEGKSKKEAINNKGLEKLWIIVKSWFENEDENNEIRGIGLYLNKQMLLDNGGDLLLRETSENGTVFEIVVPAKETDTIISQQLLFEKVLGMTED